VSMSCRARLSTALASSDASNSLNISWTLNGTALTGKTSLAHTVDMRESGTTLTIQRMQDNTQVRVEPIMGQPSLIQGEYRCIARLSAQIASTSESIMGAVISDAIVVSIAQPLTFRNLPNRYRLILCFTVIPSIFSVSTIEGSIVRLECQLEGPKTASVSWLRDRRPLDDTDESRVYR
jgi:hypothetical protein